MRWGIVVYRVISMELGTVFIVWFCRSLAEFAAVNWVLVSSFMTRVPRRIRCSHCTIEGP